MLMVKRGLLPESPHWRTFKWMCHNASPWSHHGGCVSSCLDTGVTCSLARSLAVCRSCIDIKASSRKRSDIVPSVLAIHALTGCDSVTETCGISKTRPHTWSTWSLVSRRQISPTWSNSQLISWLQAMVAKQHALPWRNAASSCGHRKHESQQQHQNCVFCHQQLKHLSKCLQSTLLGCPVVHCPEWRSSYSQWCGLQIGTRWSKQSHPSKYGRISTLCSWTDPEAG